MTYPDVVAIGRALALARNEADRRQAGDEPDGRYDPLFDSLLDLLDEVET